jgi:sugar phosphate permease
MSLYHQQVRGLSPLVAGAAFLPMMLIGVSLTPFSARAAERVGARTLIVGGLALMTAGTVMILVGLAGPTVTPPATGLLLNSVPGHQAGTSSGVFNTSRQVGGALAVAVFGALLAHQATFLPGLRLSLLLAGAVALAAAGAGLLLKSPRGTVPIQEMGAP